MNDNYDMLPQWQFTFDSLLQQYNSGHEPLENWTTEDLVKLLDSIDRELQSRGERVSTLDSSDYLDSVMEEYEEVDDLIYNNRAERDEL